MYIYLCISRYACRRGEVPFVARPKSRFHLPSSVFTWKRLNSIRTAYTQCSLYKMFCYGDTCCLKKVVSSKNVSMYNLVTTKVPTQTRIGTNSNMSVFRETNCVFHDTIARLFYIGLPYTSLASKSAKCMEKLGGAVVHLCDTTVNTAWHASRSRAHVDRLRPEITRQRNRFQVHQSTLVTL